MAKSYKQILISKATNEEEKAKFEAMAERQATDYCMNWLMGVLGSTGVVKVS